MVIFIPWDPNPQALTEKKQTNPRCFPEMVIYRGKKYKIIPNWPYLKRDSKCGRMALRSVAISTRYLEAQMQVCRKAILLGGSSHLVSG